jgi:hypothetical protein
MQNACWLLGQSVSAVKTQHKILHRLFTSILLLYWLLKRKIAHEDMKLNFCP